MYYAIGDAPEGFAGPNDHWHLHQNLCVKYGATIEVPTPEGRVQLKIPKGSQGGQRLRLRGRGVPDPKGGSPGDLYVRLMVQVPKDGANERLREAVDALERAYGDHPRAHLAL